VRPYVVRQGDDLAFIAHRLGVDADVIWNDPKNAEIKKLRTNPNILCPGDVVYVPDPAPRKWLRVKVGTSNTFVGTPRTVPLTLTFTQKGKPLAGANCVVHGMGPPAQFTTDGAGALVLAVPISTREIRVEFAAVPVVRTIRLGHLDPVNEPSGLIQRLRNLGYFPHGLAIDGVGSDLVAASVGEFQEANGLSATGEVHDPTRAALESAHGV
jgi:Putative peptidoglycan binding domain